MSSSSTSTPPFDLQVAQQWLGDLKDRATGIVPLVTARPSVMKNPEAFVRSHLMKPEIAAAFGGSDKGAISLPNEGDDYSRWLVATWGRRCGYYLGSLARGLRDYTKYESGQGADTKDLDSLLEISRNIRESFMPERRYGDTLKRSIDCGHGVTNFHRTYLDPVLFSSLVSLASIKKNSSSYDAELGITSDEDARALTEELLEIIRREVSTYTNGGASQNEILADQSTLWWGVRTLITRSGNDFHLKSPVNGEKVMSGLDGAVDLLEDLCEWTRSNPTSPTFEMALSEATPEIHCALRTNLMIAQNAISLLAYSWGDSVKAGLQETIGHVLNKAKAEWNSSSQLQKHAYFIGLALETISQYLAWAKKNGFAVPSSSAVQKKPCWTNYHLKSDVAKALIGKKCDVRTMYKRASAEGWIIGKHKKVKTLCRVDKNSITDNDAAKRRVDALDH